MKYTTVALAFFTAVATADKVEDLVTQLPACALPCFQAATGEVGCKDGDFACQCSKVDEFTMAVLPCVNKQCKPDDLVQIQTTANKICKEVKAENGGGDDDAKPSGTATSAAGSSSTPKPSEAAGARVEAGLLAGLAAAMAFL